MSSAQGTVLEPIDELLDIIIAIQHRLLKKRQEEEKLQLEIDELKEMEKELDYANNTVRNYMYAFFPEEMILTELAEAADRGGRADLTFIDEIKQIDQSLSPEFEELLNRFQCEIVDGRRITRELSKDDIKELIFEENMFSKKLNIKKNDSEKELFGTQKCSEYLEGKYIDSANSKQSIDAWKNNFGKSFEKLSANDIAGLGYARFRDSYANVVFKMQAAEIFNRHPNLLKKHEGEVTIHNYFKTGEDKVYKIVDIDRSIVAEMKSDVNFQLMQQKLQLWKKEKEASNSQDNDKTKLSKEDAEVLNKIQEKVKAQLEKDEFYLKLNEEDKVLMEQSLVEQSFKEYQILKMSHEKVAKEQQVEQEKEEINLNVEENQEQKNKDEFNAQTIDERSKEANAEELNEKYSNLKNEFETYQNKILEEEKRLHQYEDDLTYCKNSDRDGIQKDILDCKENIMDCKERIVEIEKAMNEIESNPEYTQQRENSKKQEKTQKDYEFEELMHEYEHSDFSSEQSKVDFAKKVAQSNVSHDFLKNVEGGELKAYIVAATVLELEDIKERNHFTNETFSQYYQEILNASGFSNNQISEYVDNFVSTEKQIKLTLEVENEGNFELSLPFEGNEE